MVKEVEKVNEQEINESFKEVHASISHFKTEVENLRMQVIDNYPHGKRHPSLKKGSTSKWQDRVRNPRWSEPSSPEFKSRG